MEIEGINFQKVSVEWREYNEKPEFYIQIIGEESEQEVCLSKKQVKRLTKNVKNIKKYASPLTLKEYEADNTFVEIKWDDERNLYWVKTEGSMFWQDTYLTENQLLSLLSVPNTV